MAEGSPFMFPKPSVQAPEWWERVRALPQAVRGILRALSLRCLGGGEGGGGGGGGAPGRFPSHSCRSERGQDAGVRAGRFLLCVRSAQGPPAG